MATLSTKAPPITYAEGMAGWKIELLYFACQKVNGGGATLVEPCMASGRLQSCGRYEARGVPVSKIFDLDEYMTPSSDGSGSGRKYPVIVSYNDYLSIVGNTASTTVRQKSLLR
eukprot:scaffold23452_cov80-Skeletonema_marinoi.AAC.3